MLYYMPVAGRKDRYTHQLQTWNERALHARGVAFTTILGGEVSEESGTIYQWDSRAKWCMEQNEMLLECIENGEIKEGDSLYFDEALHFGIEGLYFALKNRGVKMYAWLHGTAYDQMDMLYYDHIAKDWENSLAKIYDGVFVANHALKELWTVHTGARNVWATGHVWDSEEVYSRVVTPIPYTEIERREKRVLWTSRWDACKDPMKFLEIAEYVRNDLGRKDIKFVVCSANRPIRSDTNSLLYALSGYEDHGVVEVERALTKAEYYELLGLSRVMFSSSRMDWVSYTLLEAAAMGCFPLVPDTISFQETLKYQRYCTYNPHNDIYSIANEIIEVVETDSLFKPSSIEKRMSIHYQYDSTWDRRLNIMGICNELNPAYKYKEMGDK